MIAVMGVLLGLALALSCGGDLRRLQLLEFRYTWLVVALFLVQAVARGRLPSIAEGVGFSLPVWLVTSSLLLLVVAANRRLPMMWLIALGLGLNLLVVLLNSGMPVLHSDSTLPAAASGGTFYHSASVADTALMLADVLPTPGGWLVSLGDILLMIGIATLIIAPSVGDARRAANIVKDLA